MKFDVVVGNPPYQENDNGKRDDGKRNASASPLYHHFFNLAKKVSNEKVQMIFPARWLTGAGKGLSQFSKEMLNDRHIRALSFYQDGSVVFPNNEIKGGVLHIVYDHSYDGKAVVKVVDNSGEKYEYESYLNSAGSGIFIPYGELVSIFEKVSEKIDLINQNIQTIVSSRKPFGMATDFLENQKKYNYPKVYVQRRSASDLEIIGLINKKRSIRYVPEDYPISTGLEYINKWKVFTPYAYGSGAFGELPPKLILGQPGQLSTETFLVIGPFETEFEAQAMINYFQTKFFRALIGILKMTQHSTTTYRMIPKLDFTKDNSHINWEGSINQIDEDLYKMFELTESEISFLEQKVKSAE